MVPVVAHNHTQLQRLSSGSADKSAQHAHTVCAALQQMDGVRVVLVFIGYVAEAPLKVREVHGGRAVMNDDPVAMPLEGDTARTYGTGSRCRNRKKRFCSTSPGSNTRVTPGSATLCVTSAHSTRSIDCSNE
jgi:hypothetical protein